MITPEIKSLVSVDLESEGLPSDPTDCALSSETEIGPRGREGGDLFQFVAVTPKALMRETGAR
jgi:hypothetical protein